MAVTEAARERIAARIAFLERARDRIVMDGDTHPTDPATIPPAIAARMRDDPNYFQGRPISGEELLREMDQAGVDTAVAWQNPATTPYGTDLGANFAVLLAANRYVAEFGARHPERLIAAGWTDPKALGMAGALELVRICVEEWGCPIVKMNPAQNAYPIDSPQVLEIVDRIVGLGAVPAFHFGGDTPYTPAEGLERVAQQHPGWPVIGIHMGGGGAHFVEGEELYQKARALGLRRPNIFFVLSAKRDTHMESDLIAYEAAGEPFRRNLAVASDAPYGRQSWNYGGFRAMFASLRDGASHNDPRLRARPNLFSDEAAQNYIGRNLADLVLRIDRGFLGRV
jgi:predicted TIM-barrel fold metal-dependent hydrolase